jgi:hypothetical protein
MLPKKGSTSSTMISASIKAKMTLHKEISAPCQRNSIIAKGAFPSLKTRPSHKVSASIPTKLDLEREYFEFF